MDPSESKADKIVSEPTRYSPTTLFIILIIVVQFIIALATYPFLPNTVPIHWNAAGQVDSYGPKWINTFLFPLISLGLYVLIRVLMAVGPRLGNQGRRTNPEIVNLIIVGVLLFMLMIQLCIVAISFGLPIDLLFVVSLAMSVLFMFIGNYLGKLRRNFWAGIRTPWTIVSEVVWERTHRLGGWLFVGVGFLGLVMSFVPLLRIWGMVVALLLAVVILYVYSYVVYQHTLTSGGEALSPPFDSEGKV